ncbi:hypothetical protein RSP03_44470 [Cereibacter sphaeroides]|nr:hypothetical protein RSP03_44470 [Cereibacter sphaeroides]
MLGLDLQVAFQHGPAKAAPTRYPACCFSRPYRQMNAPPCGGSPRRNEVVQPQADPAA